MPHRIGGTRTNPEAPQQILYVGELIRLSSWERFHRCACPPPLPGAPVRPSLRRPLVAAFAALAALVAATTAVIATTSAQAADPRDSFVTRCGIRFCIDSKPAYLAGTNTYDMFTYGFDWRPGEQYVDKTKIDTQMDRLKADGVQVLRLWF